MQKRLGGILQIDYLKLNAWEVVLSAVCDTHQKLGGFGVDGESAFSTNSAWMGI